MPQPQDDQLKLIYNLVSQQAVIDNEIDRIDREFTRHNEQRNTDLTALYEQIKSINSRLDSLVKNLDDKDRSDTVKAAVTSTQIERWKAQLDLAKWVIGFFGLSGIISYVAAFRQLGGK